MQLHPTLSNTRSGTWTTPPGQEPHIPRTQPAANEYLNALCRGTHQLPDTSAKAALDELRAPTDIAEPDPEEEAEKEDTERDALQGRAAEVTVDSACTAPARTLNRLHQALCSTNARVRTHRG